MINVSTNEGLATGRESLKWWGHVEMLTPRCSSYGLHPCGSYGCAYDASRSSRLRSKRRRESVRSGPA